MRLIFFISILVSICQGQIRVNIGGPQYTDSNGNVWAADTGCTSQSTYSRGGSIQGTNDPILYQTGRTDPSQVNCTYTLTSPAFYTVTLLFAETDSKVTATSQSGGQPRVMNIYINGQLYWAQLNVMASSAFRTAYNVTSPNIAVTTGQINIQVIQVAYQAMLSGLDIEPYYNSSTVFTPTGGFSLPISTALDSAFLYDIGYSSLTNACAAAAAAHKSIAVTQIWPVPVGFLCAASLWFPTGAGGMIQPASGQTVTLLPNTQCPLTQQCYDISAGGSIAFSTPPPVVSPVQWGADISGASDSSAAIKAAWAAAANGGSGIGAVVLIPCGTFKITSGITFVTAQQQTLKGSGACTTISWAGLTSSQDMIVVPNCFACVVSDMYVNVTQPVNSTFRTENTGSGNTATQNVFKNITILGNGNAGSCFLLDGPVDGNNDQQRFEDDHCLYPVLATGAGWTLGNASSGFNVLNVVIEHSSCSGAGAGYCVDSKHGSFSFIDGDIGGSGVADFFIESPSIGGYTLHNIESESSSMFLKTVISPNSINLDLSLIDWGDSCLGATPSQIRAGCLAYTPSGNVIIWGYPGGHFRDSHFGTSGDANNLTIECVYSQVVYSLPGCAFENVIVSSSNMTLGTIFTTALPDSWTNGSYEDVGGVFHSIPDFYSANKTFNGPVTFNGVTALPAVGAVSYTPSLMFSGAASGQTGTFVGHYWTIQGLTYFTGYVELSALGSSTGTATINLPSAVVDGGFSSTYCNSGCSGLTAPIVSYLGIGATYMNLEVQGATAISGLSNANFSNTSIVSFSGWYK